MGILEEYGDSGIIWTVVHAATTSYRSEEDGMLSSLWLMTLIGGDIALSSGERREKARQPDAPQPLHRAGAVISRDCAQLLNIFRNACADVVVPHRRASHLLPLAARIWRFAYAGPLMTDVYIAVRATSTKGRIKPRAEERGGLSA